MGLFLPSQPVQFPQFFFLKIILAGVGWFYPRLFGREICGWGIRYDMLHFRNWTSAFQTCPTRTMWHIVMVIPILSIHWCNVSLPDFLRKPWWKGVFHFQEHIVTFRKGKTWPDFRPSWIRWFLLGKFLQFAMESHHFFRGESSLSMGLFP
jgi:hypothetical protein